MALLPVLLPVLLGVGCGPSGGPSVAEVAQELPPFGELRQMELGRTAARDVARLRPGARHAPYSGLAEELGEYSVVYTIPGSHSEDQAVPPDARLRAVSAARHLASDDAALEAWRQLVRDVTARSGIAPRCTQAVVASGGAYLQAEWTVRGGTLAARVVPSPAGSMPAIDRDTSRTGAAARVDGDPGALLHVFVERERPMERVLALVRRGGDDGRVETALRCPT